MDRICEVDDIIKGPISYWPAINSKWGPMWQRGDIRTPHGEWRVVEVFKDCGDHGRHYTITAISLDDDGVTTDGVVSEFSQGDGLIADCVIRPDQLTLTGRFGHTTEKVRVPA